MPVVKQLTPLLKARGLAEQHISVAQFQGTIPGVWSWTA
jgi:hypothetical protein